MEEVLAEDYLVVKIDTERMKNGALVAKRLRGTAHGGIPWLVVLDQDGDQLVTSDGPKGNIGCPMRPHEISWFLEMLRRTRQRMSDEDLATIERSLKAYAAEVLGDTR